jgi:DHA2 family multidrug resistance protein-like MFS transporter
VVAPACYVLLPRVEKTTPGKWAIGQALLLIVGMISLVYGIKAGFGGKQPLAIIVLVIVFGIAAMTLFVRKQLRSPEPMLDLSLLSHPAIVAGLIMAIVASGALAGVELTLAQELQYVLGKTPLQAGIFMIPIMAAAAVGGPVAGYLSNRFGLRLVATLSLAISAGALVYLAQSDFHQPGFLIPFALALLGLTLSIGLTASSIAIMGSVDATGYELGTGLGITLFGVFMSSAFSRAIELPFSLSQTLADQASRTIGDAYIVARELPGEQGAALIEAGKAAFTQTHAALLTTAAVVIAALAVVVFFTLAGYRSLSRPHH